MQGVAREHLKDCPFCGEKPFIEDGKRGNCQLHGEPFQPIVIRCHCRSCPARPAISAGDIYNGGRDKAILEAAKVWATRKIRSEENNAPTTTHES